MGEDKYRNERELTDAVGSIDVAAPTITHFRIGEMSDLLPLHISSSTTQIIDKSMFVWYIVDGDNIC